MSDMRCNYQGPTPIYRPQTREKIIAPYLARAEKAEAECDQLRADVDRLIHLSDGQSTCIERLGADLERERHEFAAREHALCLEIERMREMQTLCTDDTVNKCAKWLADHPESDMLQTECTTTDGEDMTLIVMRGSQDHARPLREAKAEVERLRSLCGMVGGPIISCQLANKLMAAGRGEGEK